MSLYVAYFYKGPGGERGYSAEVVDGVMPQDRSDLAKIHERVMKADPGITDVVLLFFHELETEIA